MKRAALTVALLLTSLSLAAQSNAKPQTLTLYRLPNLVAGTCPIDMHANQGVWDHTLKIREGDKERVPQPFGQRISLTLKDPRHAPITAATVRVHGLTGKNRVLQTGNEAGTSDAVTTIHLAFGAQGDAGVTGDLSIPGFTAVNFIELQEVSYSDGATWRVSGLELCRVQPDPVMLVINR